MRLLMLGLLGLLPMLDPTVAMARSDPAKATASKPAISKPRPVLAQAKSPTHGQARLQQANWRPGAAPAACSPKARHCRGTGAVRAHFGWTQGLPPAALVQANECPDGTMATLARGHDDVVRCMPI